LFLLRVHASKGIKVQKYCTHGGRVSHLSTFLTLCSGTLITENSPLITPSALDFKPRTVRSRRRPPRGSNRACVADVPPRRRTIFGSSERSARLRAFTHLAC